MPKFLVTYHGSNMPHDAESMAKARDAFMDWAGKTGRALVDPGAPIGAARTISSKGTKDGLADGPFNGGPTQTSGSQSQKPLTKRAGLSFQADPNNLFYATYSTGFRVGGSNADVPYNVCKVDLENFGLTAVPSSNAYQNPLRPCLTFSCMF